MGKILVLYDSATGNTEKMAYLVAKGAEQIEETDVRIRSVGDATPDDVLWCDGIAVGAPTNCGVLSWKMKKFWDDLVVGYWGRIDGKIGCAFSSSGGWAGGNEVTCLSILTVLMNFGFLVFGVTDYVADQFTLHYGAAVAGEPRTEREQEACRRLGRRLAQWVRVYVDGEPDVIQGTGARGHL
jgi:NAD(P)H dehydrogenase (quinone)